MDGVPLTRANQVMDGVALTRANQ